MGKRSKADKQLGRVLIKDRFGRQNRHRTNNSSMLHTTDLQDGYDWGRLNLNSVTEESTFQDFLRTAELAGTEFQAEKLNMRIVDPKQVSGLMSNAERREMQKRQANHLDLLKIPRRPKWTKEMSAQELHQAENQAFLDWRRHLSLTQEAQNLLLTPYEKNLEFWRQLWRVVERSDVVVQIVDARNPLLYRNEDLENYVHEINDVKENLLLINKADLLTPEQRQHWATYFDSQNIRAVFFSAILSAVEEENTNKEGHEKIRRNAKSCRDLSDFDEDVEDLIEDVNSSKEDSSTASVSCPNRSEEKKEGTVEKTESEEKDKLSSSVEQSIATTDDSETSKKVSSAASDCGNNELMSKMEAEDQSVYEKDSTTANVNPDETREPLIASNCVSNEAKSKEEKEDQGNVNPVENKKPSDSDTRELKLKETKEDKDGKETEEACGIKEQKASQQIHRLKNKNNPELLSRAELIAYLRNSYQEPTCKPGVLTIGLVGYPNVGKSSTINTLMAQKKVSVSSTPGKTKHFQTLFLDKDLMLCDCPGLVMPSFVFTKADMILNGILPIDQMRDHVPAVDLLCSRIPRHILEDKYGIVIAKPDEREDPNRCPKAEELLLAYGYNRGFMTANGQPDQSRAARVLLKDYVNGRLLYCVAPPDVEQSTFQQYPARIRKLIDEEDLPVQRLRALRIDKRITSKEFDLNFFRKTLSSAHVQGRTDFPHVRVNQNSVDVNVAKPWRTFKKEKRQKLRNKYSYLDQH